MGFAKVDIDLNLPPKMKKKKKKTRLLNKGAQESV